MYIVIETALEIELKISKKRDPEIVFDFSSIEEAHIWAQV